MAIESYQFGRIVIDGQRYTSDIIVYPDRVDGSWWREESHLLQTGDLEEVVDTRPEVLVVGTGYFGHMRASPEAVAHLRSSGIEVIVERTEEACKIYNRLSESRKVIAAFHLTC